MDNEGYDAPEEAADRALARRALRTLAEMGDDEPRATLAEVLAEVLGTTAADPPQTGP